MKQTRKISAVVGAFGIGAVLVAVAPAAAQVQAPIVMAQGLDNPRGLAFGPDGLLYVVEAGRGGNTALCLPNPGGAPGTRCYGPSGAVTRVVSAGVQQRVLIGLPSLAGPTGAEASGPHDLAFGLGLALLTVGSGGDPALLTPLKTAGITQFGSLLSVSPTGVVTTLLDVAAYETANNPGGGPIDSNLFGLELQTQAPARALIADAGANALLQVDANLAISTLATFPTRQVAGPGGAPVDMEAVPTSAARGPDGSIYVGELTGFPFPVGEARVYRVPAAGGTPVVVATGFTNIIDIAVGADGSAYVLEHDVNGLLQPGSIGKLTKIGPFGARTELAAGLLVAPGRMAIGPDNAVYVTTNSNAAGIGQVLKIVQ